MIEVSIQALASALESMPDEALPEIIGIGSYRGYYDQLAIGSGYGDWPEEGCVGGASTTHELAAMLRGAIGRKFHGYKGGEYLMADWTSVHVADYGTLHSGCSKWLIPLIARALYPESGEVKP